MDKTLIKIAHNIAFESSMAYAKGIVIQAPVYDTICASQMTLKKHADEFGLEHDNHITNSIGKQVNGFWGIEALISPGIL